METPTRDQIDAILKHLPALRTERVTASEWHGGTVDDEGVLTLPYEVHAREVDELIDALYECGFIQPFDWPAWQPTAEQYLQEPQRLAGADLPALVRLLTTHVKADRFCEGHFTAMIACGHITAILEKMAELRAQEV